MNSSASTVSSLVGVANDLFCQGKREDALVLYETALQVGRNPAKPSNSDMLSRQLQWGSEKLMDVKEEGSSAAQQHLDPPDTYHEDEGDVGLRPFRLPVFPQDIILLSGHDDDASELVAYADILIMYNRGLVHHLGTEFAESMRLYEAVALASSTVLQQHEENNNNNNNATITTTSSYQGLLELLMRLYNNMACISYTLGSEDAALVNLESALVFANRFLSLQESYSNELQLDYATLLSNWCRVHWVSGNISLDVQQGLEDILRIRSTVLGWKHMDTATAHFNLGLAEYARNRPACSVNHLFAYLQVAAGTKKLDSIPALIYILLVKNESKEDDMSQELVRGLRSLQEKRADVGPHGAEVASVLNYTGTLLFHQHDYEHALLFFQEELRLEENLVLNEDDVSISVTCNNIGRILQELNRLPEAKEYYYRALQGHYGDNIEEWCSQPKGSDFCHLELTRTNMDSLPHTTMQLYSAVWYNLGLIHDKLGAYAEATNAFKVSLGLRKKMLGPDHADCACLLYNIGVLQMEQQLLQEATESFREALCIRQVSSPAAGHLNDSHICQTLKKLASLHKAKGNISGALATYYEILNIQKNSAQQSEGTSIAKRKEVGTTMREIAELYHAHGRLTPAVEMAQESIILLREVQLAAARTAEFVSCTEELVSGLLLLGSLNHENCDPMKACILYNEASAMIRHVSTFFSISTELDAMHEVTQILAACHCAPLA